MGSAATTAVLTFAFPNGSLPAGATVVGVQVTGTFWADSADTVYPSDCAVTIGSKTSGNWADGTTPLSTGASTIGAGSSSTFPGTMTAPSVADVDSGSITATFQFSGPGGGPGMSEIFCTGAGITVWYTAPAGLTGAAVLLGFF